MLLKIYARQPDIIGSAIHIIEDVKDVIVYEGTYCQPLVDSPTQFGPLYTGNLSCNFYGAADGVVRIIDYTKENMRHRAVVPFAYICNENGKTIERVECSAGF